MFNHRPIVRRALALALAGLGVTWLGVTGLGVGGCGDVSGLHALATDAVTVQGIAAPGSALAVVDATGALLGRGVADAAGRFALQAPVPGRLTVVANDLRGSGALREIGALGGASLDLGPLEHRALESFPRLLDLHGVGFEERKSRDEGDHSGAAFSADRARVYTFRTLPHATTSDLVETETRGGRSRVLQAGITVADSFGEPIAPALFGDRFLLLKLEQSSGGVRSDDWVALDLETGNSRTLPSDSGTGYRGEGVLTSPYILGAPRVSMESGDVPRVLYMVQVAYREQFPTALSHVELCTVALGGEDVGTRRCVMAPGQSPQRRVEWMGARAQVLAEGALYRFDFREADLSATFIPAQGYEVNDAVWRAQGTVLALAGPGYSLLALGDGDSGDLLEVTRMAGRDAIGRIAVNTSFTHALIGLPQGSYSRVVRLEDGHVLPLPGALTVDGETLTVRAWCETPDLSPRALVADSEDEAGCFEGEPPDVAVRARLVATTEQCARLGAADARCSRFGLPVRWVPGPGAGTVRSEFPPAQSPSGLRASVATSADTGHRQLVLGGAGQAPRQATFLSADHQAPVFSLDGTRLYYFTRDPVRGYVGLFQLDVAALLRMWEGRTD